MKRLLKVQEKIGTLSKTSSNPFFKSQYLDLNDLLNAVHPLLHEEGLMLIQPIQEGKVFSTIIDSKDGGVIASSELPLPDIKDPQKLGSCITYYRRYTLKSLLAIAEKDDDGNHASKPEPKQKLTDAQFDITCNSSKKSIQSVLDNCDMTEKQRNALNLLL